jgi:hypothetical protein
MKAKGGYFAKLGILTKVEEEDEEDDTGTHRKKYGRVESPILTKKKNGMLSEAAETDEEDESETPKNTSMKLKETGERFLRVIIQKIALKCQGS